MQDLTDQTFLTIGTAGIYLNVHAQPGAKRAALRGLHGDAVKIAVKEAAQDGKANKAIEVFVAKALGLPKSSVSVTSGHTSRSKRLFMDGDAALLIEKVNHWLASS
jgi:uncharacterized protein (TIGR00251 family)